MTYSLKFLVNLSDIFPCFLWPVFETHDELFFSTNEGNIIIAFNKIDYFDELLVKIPIDHDQNEFDIGCGSYFAYAFTEDDFIYGTYETIKQELVLRYKRKDLNSDKLQMFFLFKFFGETELAKEIIEPSRKMHSIQINNLIERELEELNKTSELNSIIQHDSIKHRDSVIPIYKPNRAAKVDPKSGLRSAATWKCKPPVVKSASNDNASSRHNNKVFTNNRTDFVITREHVQESHNTKPKIAAQHKAQTNRSERPMIGLITRSSVANNSGDNVLSHPNSGTNKRSKIKKDSQTTTPKGYHVKTKPKGEI
jgi:hypothetical protein